MTNQKKNPWSSAQGLKEKLAVLIGTAFGAGYFPKAPGTAGTLVAIPLAWILQDSTWPLRAVVWIAIGLAGIWAGSVFDAAFGIKDHQMIVIDEVVGMGITCFTLHTVQNHWTQWMIAFLFFRFFDIMKLPPVRQLDRWSKKSSGWKSGVGVMLDDVLAGFQGLGVILIFQTFHFLSF